MLTVYLSLLETQEEKDKFILVYERCRDLMFYVARKYLDSQADREIAVDAALQALLGRLDRIEDPASQRTKNLAALVTRHKCIDLLRKKRGLSEEELDEAAERASAFASPSGNALEEGIASMSASGRDMILLRYLYGYSAPEIAGLLGISRDAAVKRLQRAKGELKRILEEER